MQGKKKNTFNPWEPKQANWEKKRKVQLETNY